MTILGLAIAVAAAGFGCVAHAAGEAEGVNEPAAIMEDLRENSLSAEEIRGVTAVRRVRAVNLDAISGTDLQRLQATLRDTEDNFAEIRVAVAWNETFAAELEESGVRIREIVAVTRSEDGAFTVYTGEPPRYR